MQFNRGWYQVRDTIEQQADECEHAIDFTFEIFGESAFSRYVVNKYENRFNRAIFDVMLYYFSQPELREISQARTSEIKAAFERLSREDQRFNDAVASTTKTVSATAYRLQKWGETLSDVVHQSFKIPRQQGNTITTL